MKKIITCIFAFIAINSAFGQGHFDLGSNVVGAGIGIGSSFGLTYGTQSPAISFQYEHGMWSAGGPGVISLGGFVAYKSFGYEYYTYSQKWKYTLIGVRSAYHYNGIKSDDWDLYGGLMLAYRIVSFDDNNPYTTYSYGSGVYLSGYLGARYYFSDNVAGFVELGSGIAILNLGVALKF